MPYPPKKENIGVVVTSMPPSRRAMMKAHRNSLKLSGKLSHKQVKHIRHKRIKAAQDAMAAAAAPK